MRPNNKKENAKNLHWKPPVKLPHVKPEDYPKIPGSGPPDYTMPGYPSGEDTAKSK